MGTPRVKTNVSLDQLDAFYKELHNQAARGHALVEVGRKANVKELAVFNYITGLDGIDSLAKFTAAISQAVESHLLLEALGALDGSADERIKEITERDKAAKQRAAAAAAKKRKKKTQ